MPPLRSPSTPPPPLRRHQATTTNTFYSSLFLFLKKQKLKRRDILNNSIQTRSKAHQIIKRMLSSLGDPYTRFLSPDEFSKMARYDMTGVGINLREVTDENGDHRLKVWGLILDGPAHSAGVRQGDEILAVNNMEVKGKSAFEVSSLLQGPNGTSVTIQVKHGNCGPVQPIEVQRQFVARTPVFYRMEQTDGGAAHVGYIPLKELNALARKDLVIAMKRLQDMGASYFILDLRDNLGGLVQESTLTPDMLTRNYIGANSKSGSPQDLNRFLSSSNDIEKIVLSCLLSVLLFY